MQVLPTCSLQQRLQMWYTHDNRIAADGAAGRAAVRCLGGSGVDAMVYDDRHGPETSACDAEAVARQQSDEDCGSSRSRGETTRILSRVEAGDAAAAAELLPLVYEQLRQLAAIQMAREKPGQTLQATALVHEAYLRLVDTQREQHWQGRGHFYRAAAEAMRRLLVDRARSKGRLKRGGHRQRIDLDQLDITMVTSGDEWLELDEAIEHLAREHSDCADLAKLRFFAGLSTDEAGRALGFAPRTARRHWAYARAWLFDKLRDDAGSPLQR
jgi:RNA polymerase sigma factor (TIGR02999 family)